MRSLLESDPFKPFTIVKGDGEQVNVVSRELALLYPGGRTLHVVSPRIPNATVEEDFEDHFIDVFLVTDVVRPARTRCAKNGRRRH